MKRALTILLFILTTPILFFAQTVIPNASFENWTTFSNYSDPTGWDTPNQELMAIPFFGLTVVSKSTDHHGTGSYSAKLETKHLTLPPLDVPGFMTCGKLVIDINSGSYILSGGVPVVDVPTHLKGYYKYIPKGGDSCVVGIGLTKWNAGVQDTIGYGVFSTKDTITDWAPFSAWIDYISTTAPDSMNIIAMSTAQEVMTVGTVLYVDDLYLDYTVKAEAYDPAAGIRIYNDKETSRLMIFYDFPASEPVTARLINIRGEAGDFIPVEQIASGRQIISYATAPAGLYILQIKHGGVLYSRKFFLTN